MRLHTNTRDGEGLRMRLHKQYNARDGEGLGMKLHTHTYTLVMVKALE